MLITLLLWTLAGVASAGRWLPDGRKVRGVNLGSHFIIEPWMAKDSWNKMGCGDFHDEWTCVENLTQQLADTKFQQHWNTWITREDIQLIKNYGLNTIRVPVGFWINETLVDRTQEFYPQGGLPYLDRLVGWAAEADLYVIIDLHGAPGSQALNSSFTGHIVPKTGFYTPQNYERAYQFLQGMTRHIHANDNYSTVGVLQVLNEPLRSDQSSSKAEDMIRNFYPQAYARIRDTEKSLGVADSDQLKIQYMGSDWGSGNPKEHLPSDAVGLLFDSHKYYAFGDRYDSRKNVSDDVCRDNARPEKKIVGECSIGIRFKQSDESAAQAFSFELDQVGDIDSKKAWYRSFWGAQAKIYEQGGGWVFWAWKVDHINATKDLVWSYQNSVKGGIIPEDASAAAASSFCG